MAGPELIAAIVGNAKITAVDNCPGVSVAIAKAIYGSVQNDDGEGDVISDTNWSSKLGKVMMFEGSHEDTAVWHFMADSPVHHFTVVTWYKYDNPQRVYSVFMAYENRYTVQQYIRGAGGIAPATGGTGYKTAWAADELLAMLRDLVTSNTAWQTYFGQVGPARTMKLKCWRYKTIKISAATTNVNRY